MTQRAETVLSMQEACKVVRATIQRLQTEALLGEAPNPPDIIERLKSAHLLSFASVGVSFTHHLIQEHFTAIRISALVTSAIQQGDGSLGFPAAILKEEQWKQAMFLAVEDLAVDGQKAAIEAVLDSFRSIDFQAACELVGSVPALWAEIRDLFEPTIRHLASFEEVNACWLAARYAATTGQPEFEDLVWTALLTGHPEGSTDCLEGIDSSLVLRALGPGFAEKLLQISDEDSRFRALGLLGRTPSVGSINLAAKFAIQDTGCLVRRLAFRQLFLSGRRGWIREFIRFVHHEGWSLGLLRVLKVSPRCSTSRFRRLIRSFFESRTLIRERLETLKAWQELDPTGAAKTAKAVYETTEPNADPELRYFCLNIGSNEDQTWGIPRLVNEALGPEGLTHWHELPLNILPQEERATVIKRILPELARKNQGPDERVAQLLTLDPIASAVSLLLTILVIDHSLRAEESWKLQQTLNTIQRTDVIQAVLQPDFSNLGPAEVGLLIDHLCVGFPGGDPETIRSVTPELLDAYHELLLHWRSLLPEYSDESAAVWAHYATLIGEVGDPADEHFLYQLLDREEKRIVENRGRFNDEIQTFHSGRTNVRPNNAILLSYSNWLAAALLKVRGHKHIDIILQLVSSPSHMGIAADALADAVGAEPVDLQRNRFGLARFDLVFDRRSHRKPLAGEVFQYDLAIRRAIDDYLSRGQPVFSQSVQQAFSAVARIGGIDSEGWILDRLEQYFASASTENLLEYITLAGGTPASARIEPFVRHSLTKIANHQTAGNQTHLVTKALTAFFYSDSPNRAIEILEGEAAWFLESFEFRVLLSALVWQPSQAIDRWLERLRSDGIKLAETRYAVIRCLIHRAWNRMDRIVVIQLIRQQIVKDPNLDPHNSAFRFSMEVLAKDLELQNLVLAATQAAASVEEAAGWLRYLSGYRSPAALNIAFELVERFGEQLGIISSLSPSQQKGTSLTFTGWFYLGSRFLHLFPGDIIVKIHQFAASSDATISSPAERALVWIERQRILAGATNPELPLQSGTEDVPSQRRPWQLELRHL